MNKDLSISFYSILYGMLFIVGVHYWGWVSTNLLQIFLMGLVVDFDHIPYVRLIILFFEIIFIAKYLKIIIQKEFFNQKMMFNMLIVCISGLLVWFLFGYFNIKARPILCAYSFMEEGWEERIYGENIRNANRVNIIENISIVLSILIYSYFRIREMPNEIIEKE